MTLPYEFSPFLFLRAPAYSREDFDVNTLPKILAKDFFRTALYFSSPALYEQVKSRDFDADKLSAGVKESLIKYYNRMCYRTTPFGMFSAFSHARWGDTKEGLIYNDQEKLHLQLDYRLSQVIVANSSSAAMPGYFYSNPSIYSLGRELRYIKAGRDDEAATQSQGLSAVDSSGFLSRLLLLSKNGMDQQRLKGLLAESYSCDDAEELLEELQSEELLFSELLPNVTGENFLKRVGKLLDDQEILNLVRTLESLKNPKAVKACRMEELIKPFAGGSEKIRSPFYVNFEKEVCGSVNQEYQGKLLSGLSCLRRLQQDNEKGAIQRFKKRFIERFEQQEVPLMLALDPEAGIGYEFLEETADGGELLKGISFDEPAEVRKIAWGALQEMLMNKMSVPGHPGVIVITDEDLEQFPLNSKPLSPGISIMFRICGDKVFIETAGGTTGTALIGRFTGISQRVLSHARTIAESEQAANPDIIFAEIAYSSEEHAANINTRGHVRNYEIPVLVHSTLPGEKIIGLNDLYVSVQRNEVVLRSGRLDRRVVPRAASAYNHIRSELPVFRFLSDLQYQGIEASFSLKPENLLPGRTFYPRIEYQNCILSEASWILKQNDLREISDSESFLVFANRRGISRYFALSEADKQLVFDLHDAESLTLFLSQIRKHQKLTLREFFIEDQHKALLRDSKGKIYIHQLVASLVNPLKSYSPFYKTSRIQKHAVRYVSPGGSWIYFKIYCSPQNANVILFKKIYPVILKHRAAIDKWFFIRYYDPGHHLRVRIRGDDELIRQMPALFNVVLQSYIKSGLISRLQIDTYMRELERYGAKTIDQAEQVFLSSSELVAGYLRHERDETGIIQFAIISTEQVLNAFDFQLKDKINLLEKITSNLINEQGKEKQLRSDLNKKYREHQHMVQKCMIDGLSFFSRPEGKKLRGLVDELKKFRSALGKVTPARMDHHVSDMLHMHMNRIFNTEQRKKELVIYYLCLRYYISLNARSGSVLA